MKKIFLLNFILIAFYFDTVCQSLVANINLTERGSSPTFMQSDGKTIVFVARSEVHGNELFYIDDGTDSKLLYEVTPGNGNTNFIDVKLIENSVYYVTEKDQILFYWKKNLDTSPPLLLNEIRPTTINGYFNGNFIKVNDKVIYTALNSQGYIDVFQIDGVSSIKIHQLPFNFYLENLKYLNGRYVCFAPNRIYTFDVLNNVIEFENANFSKDIIIFNNKLYFTMSEIQTGYEIWEFDGLSAPKLLKDLATGTNSTFPFKYHLGIDKFYFFVYDPISGLALYESNGTPDGTKIVLDVSSDPLLNIAGEIVSTEKGIYFSVAKNNIFDLYYKETSKPLQVVKSNVGNITWLKNGSNSYFHLYDENYGYELWNANDASQFWLKTYILEKIHLQLRAYLPTKEKFSFLLDPI
jgi:ELWxxDGT repeat protein